MSKDQEQRTKELRKAKVQIDGDAECSPGRSVDYSVQLNGGSGGDWALCEASEKPKPDKVYDLLERTATFGEAIIRFSKRIPRGPGNDRLIGQLVGSGTSIGANYCEADDAVSKKDFKHKIGIFCQEAKERKFWLRMTGTAQESLRIDARQLWKEVSELHLILCAIFRKC